MKIKEGMIGSFSKTLTEADVILYAGITGDFNPVHINNEFAKNSMFKSRIAHGILILGFVSNVLGMQLPGPETILRTLECKFLKPAFIGDTITAVVEIKKIEQNKINLDFHVKNQNEEILIDGKTFVSIPK